MAGVIWPGAATRHQEAVKEHFNTALTEAAQQYSEQLGERIQELYALSMAISMMHDCQIDSGDMVPEGYDREPRYIPRNMLGHVQNEAMLEFMFQTALITTKHLDLDEDRRLELAFGDGVKPEFSPAAFLTRFANYGVTKLRELISDTDDTETMEAFMSCLNDTYEAGVGSIEASDDLEDI